jgi:hypothetical protein
MPGIFVGYSDVSKAYKVYHPQTQKMVITRDVHFHEEKQWDWGDTQRNVQLSDLLQDEFVDNLQIMGTADLLQDESFDDSPIKGTRSLDDIYQRSNVAICEPEGNEEAKHNPEWKKAMQEEICMIEKNCTWELVDRPPSKNFIGVKWIFRTKLNADSTINKYKVRLVVKGYAQIYGVDYSDIFAPVAGMDTIRFLFVVAAYRNWKVF